MSTDFPPSCEELIDEFEAMPDWDDRWDYVIDLGRELPELPAEHKTAENLVHGCMSTVWLVTRQNSNDNPAMLDSSNEQIEILADSDSLIVKGLIVVLLSYFNSKSPVQIIKSDEKDFLSKLGLDQHLSPNRRNGLFSMVSRIKVLATEIAAQGN